MAAADSHAPPRITTGKKRQRAASDRIRYIFGDMHGIMADRKVVSSVLSDIEQLELLAELGDPPLAEQDYRPARAA